MKLSREELEMQVLKHLTSDQKSVIRATALSINAEHFSYKEEGSKISYTTNLAKVVFKYFEESDGSLLTELVLENRMIAQGLSDVHKGRFLTLWAEIQDLDIDSNELHDLLMQLKQNELMRPLYKKLNDAIELVAKENKFTQILTVQGNQFAYIDEKFDITKLVMNKLGLKEPEIKD